MNVPVLWISRHLEALSRGLHGQGSQERLMRLRLSCSPTNVLGHGYRLQVVGVDASPVPTRRAARTGTVVGVTHMVNMQLRWERANERLVRPAVSRCSLAINGDPAITGSPYRSLPLNASGAYPQRERFEAFLRCGEGGTPRTTQKLRTSGYTPTTESCVVRGTEPQTAVWTRATRYGARTPTDSFGADRFMLRNYSMVFPAFVVRTAPATPMDWAITTLNLAISQSSSPLSRHFLAFVSPAALSVTRSSSLDRQAASGAQRRRRAPPFGDRAWRHAASPLSVMRVTPPVPMNGFAAPSHGARDRTFRLTNQVSWTDISVVTPAAPMQVAPSASTNGLFASSDGTDTLSHVSTSIQVLAMPPDVPASRGRSVTPFYPIQSGMQ